MFDSFEVTIMVIGVSISWALNSYSLVFFDCSYGVFNTFVVHDSLLLMVFAIIVCCHLNLEAVKFNAFTLRILCYCNLSCNASLEIYKKKTQKGEQP